MRVNGRTETDHVSRVDILIVLELRRQFLLRVQTKLVNSQGNLRESGADRTIGTVDGSDEFGGRILDIG